MGWDGMGGWDRGACHVVSKHALNGRICATSHDDKTQDREEVAESCHGDGLESLNTSGLEA